MSLVILCCIFGVGICFGKENYLEDLIDTIFNSTKNTNDTKLTYSLSTSTPVVSIQMPISSDIPQTLDKQSCGINKECVPYFLCKNDTVVKNGAGIIDIRADPTECGYLDACCSLKDEVATPIVNIPKQKEGCGYQNIDGVGFKITGNKNYEAQFGEFPWMLAILSEEKYADFVLNLYKCGGSLISPSVGLTAAHCVHKLEPGSMKVRAGEWDTQSESEILPFQERRVAEVIIHPSFDNESLVNDVALVFVNPSFEYAENVKSICLPSSNESTHLLPCYATGWGKTEFGKKGKYQVILKKIDLSIVSNYQCQTKLRKTRLGNYFELHQSFLCAGGDAGKDTCKGDGGSPLFCLMPGTSNRFNQVGIVAWGIGCGEKDIPGVYASVRYQRLWIAEELKKKSIETSGWF